MQRSGTGVTGPVTLNRVVREVTMHRPEDGGGASHMAVWEKAPQGEQEHVQRPCGRRACPGNRGRLV